MKKQIRLINHDLFCSMLPSFLGTHLFDDMITFFVDTYIAVILGRLTDAIISHDIGYLKSNILLILGCLCFKIVLEPLLFAFFSSKSVYGSTAFIRRLLLHYLHKPYAAVAADQAGDIPSRIDNDMMDFVRLKLMQTGNRIMIPVFLIYFMWIIRPYHMPYVAVALTVTTISYVAPIVARKRLAVYDAEERTYHSANNIVEVELASNACALHGLHLQNRLIGKIEGLFAQFFRDVFIKRECCQIFVSAIGQICQHGSKLFIIIVGAFFLHQQKISYGEIASMLSLTASMIILLEKGNYLITKKPILRNLYDRLQFFYNSETEVGTEPQKKTPVPVIFDQNALIVGEKLSLKYDDHYIFDGFSFFIPRGKITLIKGENGCGKSTLLRLICGFERPNFGKLWFDGQEITGEDCSAEGISLCTQDSTMFRYASPKENAQLGSGTSSSTMNITPWITSFSLNAVEDAPTSENLSGGEVQKIKLIRALLKQAELLILDEPENHLDADGIHTLRTILKNKHQSIVIVSHTTAFNDLAEHTITIAPK